MKKKQLTWIIAAIITLIGTLLLKSWFDEPSSWKGLVGIIIGAFLLYPSVKGWAEIIEPTKRKDGKQA